MIVVLLVFTSSSVERGPRAGNPPRLIEDNFLSSAVCLCIPGTVLNTKYTAAEKKKDDDQSKKHFFFPIFLFQHFFISAVFF